MKPGPKMMIIYVRCSALHIVRMGSSCFLHGCETPVPSPHHLRLYDLSLTPSFSLFSFLDFLLRSWSTEVLAFNNIFRKVKSPSLAFVSLSSFFINLVWKTVCKSGCQSQHFSLEEKIWKDLYLTSTIRRASLVAQTVQD